MIDPQPQTVMILTFKNGLYQEAVLGGNDQTTSPPWSEFVITAGQVLHPPE